MQEPTLTDDVLSAHEVLSNKDSVMATLVSEIGPIHFGPQKEAFETLCELVVGQQLSGAAASRICSRIRSLEVLENGLTPRSVLRVELEDLISCGISKAKAEYMKIHAEVFLKQPGLMDSLLGLPDITAIYELTRIRGIGPWTASILLMSCHSRTDIFPHGDGTLDRMIFELYGIDRKRNHSDYKALVEKWSPHRTLAARYLWCWADRDK